jgi:protein involved in polysaccharide export with SLBB domain
MHNATADDLERNRPQPETRNSSWRLAALTIIAAVAAAQGCAAVSNPVANGVPVRLLPPELLAESKEGLQTIPLSTLRQPPQPAYKLAPGDVVGIWVEGVLGEKNQPPMVRVPESGKQAALVGYPLPVRADGTLPLPLVPPLKVEGMTVEQAEEAVRKAYTIDRPIIKPGRESVIVTLQRPREYHILVIRQDSEVGTTPGAGAGVTGARSAGFLLSFGGGARGTRKGTGFAIDLPAYENDVLNALARTGGFPGSDAVNEIIVERGSFKGENGRQDMIHSLQACPPGTDPLSVAGGAQRIRIPLRYRPGQAPNLRPEDIVLQSGDIVYIEARESDVFYTAGLLPSGEYILPRDTDLDILQAITRVGGPIEISGLNTANISGTIVTPGLSFPNPTLISVIRRTPDGGQVAIRVDVDRALRDPRERILIQAKDLIILQERPDEGLARYLSEMYNFNYRYFFSNGRRSIGSTTINLP